jgi:hypothetical protein
MSVLFLSRSIVGRTSAATQSQEQRLHYVSGEGRSGIGADHTMFFLLGAEIL